MIIPGPAVGTSAPASTRLPLNAEDAHQRIHRGVDKALGLLHLLHGLFNFLERSLITLGLGFRNSLAAVVNLNIKQVLRPIHNK